MSSDLRWERRKCLMSWHRVRGSSFYPTKEPMNYLLCLEGTGRDLMLLDEIFTGLSQVRISTTEKSVHKS